MYQNDNKCNTNTIGIVIYANENHMTTDDNTNYFTQNQSNTISIVTCTYTNHMSTNDNSNYMQLHHPQIPFMYFGVHTDEINYIYNTEVANNSCQGFKGDSCVWLGGKILGGSSTINTMMYLHGQRADYDAWELLHGAKNWRWGEVLKYFKKSENTTYPPYRNSSYHGTTGPYTTTLTVTEFNVRNILYEAGNEIGLQKITDDSYPQIGIYDSLLSTENGRRLTTADAFLSKYKDRENLFMSLETSASKVLFDKNKNAIGVQVKTSTGELINLRAKNEVIISAGTIVSPQILMQSGIGDRDHLTKFGIKTIVNQKHVGMNVKDHLATFLLLIRVDAEIEAGLKSKMDSAYEYFQHNDGSYSGIGLVSTTIFANTRDPNATLPNIQVHLTEYRQNDDFLLPNVLNGMAFSETASAAILEANKNSVLFSFGVTLLYPKSTGLIRLNSTDPFAYPSITTGYLTDPDDIEVLLEGIEFGKQLMSTEAFRRYNAEYLRYQTDNCEGFEYDTRDFWVCFLRDYAGSIYHPTGSVKMGGGKRPDSVVDEKLKVIGVKKLRVADCSIMPDIVGGNTMAPAVMIGEKAADMIKTDWGYPITPLS